MSQSGACTEPTCTVATDGRCIEGYAVVEDCPNYQADATEQNSVTMEEDEEEVPTPRELVPSVALPTGEAMGIGDITSILGRARTSLVALVGPADSGKTTLAYALYQQYQWGAFGELLLAGSATLMGWERRCHRARLQSVPEDVAGLAQRRPETERTPRGEPMRFLHLQMRQADLGQPVRDLLVADITGEAYERAAGRLGCDSRRWREVNQPLGSRSNRAALVHHSKLLRGASLRRDAQSSDRWHEVGRRDKVSSDQRG